METKINRAEITCRQNGFQFKKNEKINRKNSITNTINTDTAKHHSFPIVVVQMALLLVNRGGVSFRSVSKVFEAMNTSFNLSLPVPTHATILTWMKKQGIDNFMKKTFFEDEKWILIIDESVQFGNKKLLVVLAVKESKIEVGKALIYTDLVPLIIKASESWKSDEIKRELLSCIDFKQISYVVSDNGNNLKGNCRLSNLIHIEDIGHKFSGFIKKVFENQTDFESYTKHLSCLRGKLALSKLAHIIPPNQRIMSRFMNLSPLFKWGCKILKLIDNQKLNAFEMKKVAFVLNYRKLIMQTNKLLEVLNSAQKIIKNKHLSKETVKECFEKFNEIKDENGKKIIEMVKLYFENTLQKIPKTPVILCSSDIIESCFGRYKEVVKSNKSIGITDLSLSISCLTSLCDFKQTQNALENVKIKDIKLWKDENIGESLLTKRNKLFKKTG